MNTIGNLLTNLCTLLCCVRETLGYALIFLWAIFCPKAVLAAKLLAVESQLAVCKHQIGQRKRRRPRFTASFRLLWVVLSKSLDKWEDLDNPLGAVGMVSKSEPSLVITSTSRQDRVFRRDNDLALKVSGQYRSSSSASSLPRSKL